MTEGKRDTQFYEQRASDEMARHFLSADYDTRQKLALAGRMLAREEHESGLAGQITARAERPDTFWTARFGYPHPLSPVGLSRAARRALDPPHAPAAHFRAVNAGRGAGRVAHGHHHVLRGRRLPAGLAGRAPKMLGRKRAILLAHHGQLVACPTIEEAAVLAVFMERAAKMQLRARAIGPIKPISPELAREARQYRLKPKAIEATFNYFARQIRRDQGDKVIK